MSRRKTEWDMTACCYLSGRRIHEGEVEQRDTLHHTALGTPIERGSS